MVDRCDWAIAAGRERGGDEDGQNELSHDLVLLVLGVTMRG
jgi:hypothetical protein